MSKVIISRSIVVGRRGFSVFRPALLPSNPTSSPNADADTAKIPRDKQGSNDKSELGGSGQGHPTTGGSGGPTEQTGLADPGIPEGEAHNAKQGMTKDGEDAPARH